MIGTALTLGLYISDPDQQSLSVLTGLTASGLIAAISHYRSDDYYRSLWHVGMRWSTGGIAAYLCSALLLRLYDIAYRAGYSIVAEGEIERSPSNIPALANDATFLALAAAMMFYVGYAYASLHDRFSHGNGS
ncbi:MAG: hypothetical protein WA922_10990 [Pontixanthobacter sp.]